VFGTLVLFLSMYLCNFFLSFPSLSSLILSLSPSNPSLLPRFEQDLGEMHFDIGLTSWTSDGLCQDPDTYICFKATPESSAFPIGYRDSAVIHYESETTIRIDAGGYDGMCPFLSFSSFLLFLSSFISFLYINKDHHKNNLTIPQEQRVIL
jgi:hypothetical protein